MLKGQFDFDGVVVVRLQVDARLACDAEAVVL